MKNRHPRRTLAVALACALAAAHLPACSSDGPDSGTVDDTQDTAETGDTTDTTDTTDTGDTGDTTDTAAAPEYPDAGPRPMACPDLALIRDDGHQTPPSATACPADPPAWFTSDTPPAPTLALEAGTVDESGAFVPWTDGQWASVHWGMRLGAGVWMALRVELPGETADKVNLQLETPGLIGCELVGTTMFQEAPFVAAPGEPGVYTFGGNKLSGACILLAYSADEVNAFCDHWMVVTARVRRPDTDVWGEVQHVVRLYVDE